jgi:hypothetical protein
MSDMCVYHVQLQGKVDEAEVNAMSPLQMTNQRFGGAGTYFTVHTDQSGLIGLLRHLHSRGFRFLSFQSSDETTRRSAD